MSIRKYFRIVFIVLLLVVCAQISLGRTSDPLPSWNEGEAKQALVDFVEKTTREGSPDFIPEPERIATFDNDGTLWTEKPIYFQMFFAFDRIRQLAPDHPEWAGKEPYASVLKGDLKGALRGSKKALLEIVRVTHAGMTTTTFEKLVKDWIATARHPKTGRLLTEMVYQPMLELLAYLRSNGFKTYVVSGGSMEFMRPWTEDVYGIPPEQVVGSSVKTKFVIQDGKPVLLRLPEEGFVNNKAAKPVGINEHIGRRPVAVFGNSNGDLQMLQWTTSGPGARLGLLVHHTDAEREWAYDRGADDALKEAKEKGWIIVDMKQDWKTIYPSEK